MPERAREPFALLDDRTATPDAPTSRLYLGFAGEHRCTDPAQLDAVWAGVEADQRHGLHAVLLADYEWGAKLQRAGTAALRADDASALRVLMFRELQRLSFDDTSAWLLQRAGSTASAAGVLNFVPGIDRAEFTEAIARIHEAIAAGETYQVNFTYRLNGQAHGSPLALYRRLRERQPVAYGAFIELPDEAPPAGAHGAATSPVSTPATASVAAPATHVLSCSPELFLRHDAGRVTARPMKGTAARANGVEGDSETARHLSIDTKNRAENLMIVDLLRNDLGRLAETGSVKVPELFAVEPYSTVFQMTSTIEARLRPEVRFTDVLRATFPCGSITGAPKHRTMQLIERLESTPRGLYCGAIGWVDAVPDGAACGNFCLSVAIRTATLGAESPAGVRALRFGVGAGIVADSRADDEFEECRLKARFLTGLPPAFELFETMLALSSPAARPVVQHLGRHLDRIERSAAALGFAFDRAAALRLVVGRVVGLAPGAAHRAGGLAPGAAWRLRLALAHDGTLDLQHAALSMLSDEPVGLLVADSRLPDANPLASHKTTLRHAYDEGVRAAERVGAFDSLFFTRDGRLVEGGRTSVFLRLAGRWFTPSVAEGALPGVMRGLLLDDPQWAATERRLTADDLHAAEAIVVCNALRGVLKARLVAPAAR